MPHLPAWHILDNTFSDENSGLTPPVRHTMDQSTDAASVCRTDSTASVFNTLDLGEFRLRISNLDRSDPQGYVSGGVPRTNQFNRNSGAKFRIAANGSMPVIPVVCDIEGFDPNTYPVFWRLQCLHVLCRHQPQGNYQYRGACEILNGEWQGKSRSSSFKLFEPASNVNLDYDYNSNDPGAVVMGGNAILSVAANPAGSPAILIDYVHLRIGGTNPKPADVTSYLNNALQSRNPNLPHMVNAIFTHENNFAQFQGSAQTRTHMIFRQKHHHNDPSQPDCNVLFDWPDDPENFPSVSFDWGVGISQYTKTLGITVGAATAWDWRENIKRGINEFLGKLAGHYTPGMTWRQWAHRSWKAYNGSGPQADAYANTLEALPDGQAVSTALIPSSTDIGALTTPIPGPPDLGSPPAWPPFP